MATIPTYEEPANSVIPLDRYTNVSMAEIVRFLNWVIQNERLAISEHLSKMEDDPFFLVAATGLGKTVAVPIHVLLRQIQRAGKNPNPTPRVWVVEPRIPIATDQQEYMNRLWGEYCQNHSPARRRLKPLFGCVTSVSGRHNRDAPIQFVTTGIFEIHAREGNFDPINDRVIIDEAHVTVEQNPGVELGIALCKKANVTVDYMSATVDVTTLKEDLGIQTIIRADQARNIIWKSNLFASLESSIVDLVAGTLVSPQPDNQYFPSDEYRHAQKVIESAFEQNRSHGMLVVVNSFNGEASDIRLLSEKIKSHHPQIPVLQLAGDVIRDPKRQASFKSRLRTIEHRKQNYVILSTSVVEMGITFPTLDYVVTMDSGYDQETIGEKSFPVKAPLGVNALLQRIGRVGRRRPGIAYISNEVGAEYSSLDDTKLNSNALTYEPIHFPLRRSPLMPLVYYAAQHDWGNLEEWLAELDLPSRIHEDPDRMEFFREQLKKLETLGITERNKLTPLGKMMEKWIGRADIAYVTHLQKRFSQGAPREEVLFWIAATALSDTPVGTLKAPYGYFVDYANSRKDLGNRIDIWSGANHEDVALFRAIAQIAALAPHHVWNRAARNELNSETFDRLCVHAGVNSRQIVKNAQAIAEMLTLFVKINGKTPQFGTTFGNKKSLVASEIDWLGVSDALPVDAITGQLTELAGTTVVSLEYVAKRKAYEWTDMKHGHTGEIRQDGTTVKLDASHTYVARVIPGRESKEDKASWRIASLGTTSPGKPLPPPKPLQAPAAQPMSSAPSTVPIQQSQPQPNPQAAQQESPKKQGLFKRLVDSLFN